VRETTSVLDSILKTELLGTDERGTKVIFAKVTLNTVYTCEVRGERFFDAGRPSQVT